MASWRAKYLVLAAPLSPLWLAEAEIIASLLYSMFILCEIPFGISRLVIFPIGGMNGFLTSVIFGVITGGCLWLFGISR